MSQGVESLVYPSVLGTRSRTIPTVVDPDLKVPHQLVNGRELLDTVQILIREPCPDKVTSNLIQLNPMWHGASSPATDIIAKS